MTYIAIIKHASMSIKLFNDFRKYFLPSPFIYLCVLPTLLVHVPE